MANKTINDYSPAVGIDAVNDYMLIEQSGVYNKINRNTIMGVTGTPADLSSSQTFTNKVIGNTNTVTLKDTNFTLQDDGDTTKQANFQLSGITTATTRTLTIPNRSSTIATLDGTQTFTGANSFTGSSWSGGTIDNATVTVDSIAGHTSSTTGTVYGVGITSGVFSSSNIIVNANVTNNALQTSKIFNPYKFLAYLNAAQTINTGADRLINYDTIVYDTGGNFNTTSHQFFAPITGWYVFGLFQTFPTTGSLARVTSTLYINGNPYIQIATPNINGTICSSDGYTPPVQVTAGQPVDMRLQPVGANAALTVGSLTVNWFAGELVSLT